MSGKLARLCCCSVLLLNGVASAQGGIRPGNVAEDINPSPTKVEIVLTATEQTYDFGTGNQTVLWTYNGSVPGPTIEANVGDTLIVHFTNELPEETTIHWHGLELPADMDGSHIAQTPIPPGGSFRYEFRLLRAAMFWYHPHVRTNVQVEKGLHGVLLVHDPEANQRLGLPAAEHVLVLDDVLLDDNGQVMDPWPADPVARAVMHVNGREGNTLLVNGRSGFTATIANGVPHRLRLLNASNARFMRVSIPGHTLWRIGGDGGLLETPIALLPVDMVEPGAGDGMMDDGTDGEMGEEMEMGDGMMSNPDPAVGLLLTPAERADVVFLPTGQDPIVVEWHDMARGRHSAMLQEDGTIALGHAHDDGQAPPRLLAVFHLDGNPAAESDMPPGQLREIEAIDATGAAVVPVMFGHGPPTSAGDVVFFAQMKAGQPLPFDLVTPADAPTIGVGDTRVWEVNNMTGGDHNFHMHGFHFQLIETEYVDMDNPANNRVVPAPYLEDKDTIHLPRRPGAMGASRTVTRLAVVHGDEGREGRILAGGKTPTPERSGGWLFHCHLLEHSAAGMMSFFQIVDVSTAVGEVADSVPGDIQLDENFPNPFNPQTQIAFRLPAKSDAVIAIYNGLGQEVRRLVEGKFDAGSHRARWDGRDDRGEDMASGVYFYRLRAGSYTEVKKMSLVR